jgi:hypothetical protein
MGGLDLHLFKCPDAFDSAIDSVGYLAEDDYLHLNEGIIIWQDLLIEKK